MNKTVTSIAFAAGCVLAFAATAPAQAQAYAPNPRANAQDYYAQQYQDQRMAQPQPYMGQQPQIGTRLETNGPQASRGDFGDWSARRNVIESAQYDRLLQTNMAFRHAREHRECGPIGDLQLRQQCLASFQQFEPVMTGSSMPPRRWHNRDAGY